MFFKKKIVFTDKMNETLCSFDEIPWFSCCGVSYDKPSYYPYLQEKDPKRAEKLLLHTKNYSGTVCLTNCSATSFLRNWDSILEKKRANLRSISEPARLRQPPPQKHGIGTRKRAGSKHTGGATNSRPSRAFCPLVGYRLLSALYGPFCGPLRPFGGCPWGVTPSA